MVEPDHTVMIFSDSIGYGLRPDGSEDRHAFADRWPNVLAAGLGPRVEVITEALSGRMTAFDDSTTARDLNGARILPSLLHSHAPLDLVVIALGLNDLIIGERSVRNAGFGLTRLVEIIRNHPFQGSAPKPDILIVGPTHLCAASDGSLIFASEIAASQEIGPHFQSLAAALGSNYFDASQVAKPDPRDGVHLDAANTRAIGRALVPVVKAQLGL